MGYTITVRDRRTFNFVNSILSLMKVGFSTGQGATAESRFRAVELKTKGFRFNREEANER